MSQYFISVAKDPVKLNPALAKDCSDELANLCSDQVCAYMYDALMGLVGLVGLVGRYIGSYVYVPSRCISLETRHAPLIAPANLTNLTTLATLANPIRATRCSVSRRKCSSWGTRARPR